jgi:hypothetical protein
MAQSCVDGRANEQDAPFPGFTGWPGCPGCPGYIDILGRDHDIQEYEGSGRTLAKPLIDLRIQGCITYGEIAEKRSARGRNARKSAFDTKKRIP